MRKVDFEMAEYESPVMKTHVVIGKNFGKRRDEPVSGPVDPSSSPVGKSI